MRPQRKHAAAAGPPLLCARAADAQQHAARYHLLMHAGRTHVSIACVNRATAVRGLAPTLCPSRWRQRSGGFERRRHRAFPPPWVFTRLSCSCMVISNMWQTSVQGAIMQPCRQATSHDRSSRGSCGPAGGASALAASARSACRRRHSALCARQCARLQAWLQERTAAQPPQRRRPRGASQPGAAHTRGGRGAAGSEAAEW